MSSGRNITRWHQNRLLIRRPIFCPKPEHIVAEAEQHRSEEEPSDAESERITKYSKENNHRRHRQTSGHPDRFQHVIDHNAMPIKPLCTTVVPMTPRTTCCRADVAKARIAPIEQEPTCEQPSQFASQAAWY